MAHKFTDQPGYALVRATGRYRGMFRLCLDGVQVIDKAGKPIMFSKHAACDAQKRFGAVLIVGGQGASFKADGSISFEDAS